MKIKQGIVDISKKGAAGLRLDCEAYTANLARESSAEGADRVSAQSGASVQPLLSSSVRPLTSVDGQYRSPATLSADANTSLENSFAHLQLSGDSLAERSHEEKEKVVNYHLQAGHQHQTPLLKKVNQMPVVMVRAHQHLLHSSLWPNRDSWFLMQTRQYLIDQID